MLIVSVDETDQDFFALSLDLCLNLMVHEAASMVDGKLHQIRFFDAAAFSDGREAQELETAICPFAWLDLGRDGLD